MLDIESQLRQEFDSLRCKKVAADSLSKFKAACCPQNMCKNRYYNILPNEESRVKLHALVDGDSDYINANFVGCEKVRRKYILTQAPLPNTMNDLWRMVWQEKVPVIVCLTKMSEGEVQKAHKYWPDEGQTMQFGKLLVKQTRSQLVSNIAVRHFDMWLEGDWKKECLLQVAQMHYLDWPDHGTPCSTQPIRMLANLVTERAGPAGPVVVHCSAGVGRAGTFVAIHMTMNQLDLFHPSPSSSSSSSSKASINIKDLVCTLRSQREGTVQTVDQYIFIYKVVADSILSCKRHSLILAFQNASPSSSASLYFMDIVHRSPSKCTKDSAESDHADISSPTEVR
jgi:protein tyrosine phosphatase